MYMIDKKCQHEFEEDTVTKLLQKTFYDFPFRHFLILFRRY